METAELLDRAKTEGWTDEHVVERVLAGETGLYEIIMRRYNQRLYRIARAIVRDDSEAEDVMQDAYVRAYQHLDQFAGRSAFSTWLTKIAVHEALARVKRRSRSESLDSPHQNGDPAVNPMTKAPNPEQSTSAREVRQILEEALLELPEAYRAVLMLRDVEELSTSETAEALSLSEENVKVRLHRGRAILRKHLAARISGTTKEVFPFMGARCDRVVRRVFELLAAGR